MRKSKFSEHQNVVDSPLCNDVGQAIYQRLEGDSSGIGMRAALGNMPYETLQSFECA